MIFKCVGNYTDIDVGKWKWGIYTVNHVAPPRIMHGIILIIEGKITFKSQKTIVEAGAGDVIFVPKGSCYYAYMHNTKNYLVNFNNDAITANEPIKLLKSADKKYYEYFEEAIDMQIKSESELLLKSRFYRLIDLINKDVDGFGREDSLVKKAKKLIDDDNYPTITDIAKKCAVSESSLRTHFKEAYGVSPIEYKMKIKINKAKFLLEATSLTTAQISEKLGFYDCAYFSKTFKKHVGCSPCDYKKNKLL